MHQTLAREVFESDLLWQSVHDKNLKSWVKEVIEIEMLLQHLTFSVDIVLMIGCSSVSRIWYRIVLDLFCWQGFSACVVWPSEWISWHDKKIRTSFPNEDIRIISQTAELFSWISTIVVCFSVCTSLFTAGWCSSIDYFFGQ